MTWDVQMDTQLAACVARPPVNKGMPDIPASQSEYRYIYQTSQRLNIFPSAQIPWTCPAFEGRNTPPNFVFQTGTLLSSPKLVKMIALHLRHFISTKQGYRSCLNDSTKLMKLPQLHSTHRLATDSHPQSILKNFWSFPNGSCPFMMKPFLGADLWGQALAPWSYLSDLNGGSPAPSPASQAHPWGTCSAWGPTGVAALGQLTPALWRPAAQTSMAEASEIHGDGSTFPFIELPQDLLSLPLSWSGSIVCYIQQKEKNYYTTV